MCILFIYNGAVDDGNDYSLILISNRDENYDRQTQKMMLCSEDPIVVGGRDLEVADGGTWLAVSPTYEKIGVLLNIPGIKKENAKSRGKIVASYVQSDKSSQNYVESIKSYSKECNEFVFVSVEFGSTIPSITSYSNVDDQMRQHNDTHLGFGNNLPESPLKKVQVGRTSLQDICNKFNKESMEAELVDNLIALLKSGDRHLPDQQLEARHPNSYEELSSIYVCMPLKRYGTRTHSIILLTKTGRLYVMELTQEMPIDPLNPKWEKTEFTFNIQH